MLRSAFSKRWSWTPSAIADIAMNCRFVNPVSNTKLSCTATSMASAARIMSSKRCRAAIITHSVVWYARWVQSKLPSRGRRSWPSSNGICACRISSSAPSVAMVRHALSRPKRAIRSSPTAAAYSDNANRALWNLTSWSHPRSSSCLT